MVSWDTLPPEPITDHATPKDVYRYTNDTAPVSLCLSCAAKRRRDGRTVELVSDGMLADAPCMDCDAGRPIPYRQSELM